MRSYGGFELPERFAAPATEVEVARGTAALFDLSFRGCLRFTGSDRVAFLHNMTSNDVRALLPGQGCRVTILTQQSRVVAEGHVLCAADALLLEIDLRAKTRVRAHLERYLVADDVEIDDASDAGAMLGVAGPRAVDVVRRAIGGEPPAGDVAHSTAAVAGAPVRVVRLSWSGDDGFAVLAPRESAETVWRAVAEAGASFGARPAGMLAFDVLRVEAGIPWVGVDVDDSTLVLESGLERGVSFQKGCYLGQEVVERQSARGHVNRRLVGLRFESDAVPRAGAAVRAADSDVGRVTSAVFSPTLGRAIALAMLKRPAFEPATAIEVDHAPEPLRGEVVALPFRRRS